MKGLAFVAKTPTLVPRAHPIHHSGLKGVNRFPNDIGLAGDGAFRHSRMESLASAEAGPSKLKSKSKSKNAQDEAEKADVKATNVRKIAQTPSLKRLSQEERPAFYRPELVIRSPTKSERYKPYQSSPLRRFVRTSSFVLDAPTINEQGETNTVADQEGQGTAPDIGPPVGEVPDGNVKTQNPTPTPPYIDIQESVQPTEPITLQPLLPADPCTEPSLPFHQTHHSTAESNAISTTLDNSKFKSLTPEKYRHIHSLVKRRDLAVAETNDGGKVKRTNITRLAPYVTKRIIQERAKGDVENLRVKFDGGLYLKEI